MIRAASRPTVIRRSRSKSSASRWAKALPTLQNVAQLCHWLEATHNIPQAWPVRGFRRPPRPLERIRAGTTATRRSGTSTADITRPNSQMPENYSIGTRATPSRKRYRADAHDPRHAGFARSRPSTPFAKASRKRSSCATTTRRDPRPCGGRGSDAACPPVEDEEFQERQEAPEWSDGPVRSHLPSIPGLAQKLAKAGFEMSGSSAAQG